MLFLVSAARGLPGLAGGGLGDVDEQQREPAQGDIGADAFLTRASSRARRDLESGSRHPPLNSAARFLFGGTERLSLAARYLLASARLTIATAARKYLLCPRSPTVWIPNALLRRLPTEGAFDDGGGSSLGGVGSEVLRQGVQGRHDRARDSSSRRRARRPMIARSCARLYCLSRIVVRRWLILVFTGGRRFSRLLWSVHRVSVVAPRPGRLCSSKRSLGPLVPARGATLGTPTVRGSALHGLGSVVGFQVFV